MTKTEIKALSFEQAMGQLEKIVDALDSGEVDLEKSIEIYEQGAALQRHCEDKLKQAEMRVQKIVAGPDGKAAAAEDTSFE